MTIKSIKVEVRLFATLRKERDNRRRTRITGIY